MKGLPLDFRDLLLDLADAGAEFVLLGGYAVAFHRYPSAKKDMDLFKRADVITFDEAIADIATLA